MSTNMIKRAEQFLQQKEDYDWLIASCNVENGHDRCGERFPSNNISSDSTGANFDTDGNQRSEKRVQSKNNSRNLNESNSTEDEKQRHGKPVVPKKHSSDLTRANFAKGGQERCDERLVVTTFPGDLTTADFEEYIDRKFSDLNKQVKERMKELYKTNTDIDMEKNVSFDYNIDDGASATLTQILIERTNSYNELKISVGYIKFTRKPVQEVHYLQNYWQNNIDRVVRALQYKYGQQLKSELC